MLEIIGSASVTSVFDYAVSFNQPHNLTSNRIMQLILDTIRQKITNFSRFDLVGFFHNAFERDYIHFDQYKNIAENIAQFI